MAATASNGRGFVLAAAALAAFVTVASLQARAAETVGTIETATGRHVIEIEVVDTPESREIGLMNRPSMPAGHGMLFDFVESRPVTMWMKNTLIPLDMLFMDETGVVRRVHANAQPGSLDLIPSGGPVRYVLELNGGAAATYAVKAGDRLRHPIIPADR